MDEDEDDDGDDDDDDDGDDDDDDDDDDDMCPAGLEIGRSGRAPPAQQCTFLHENLCYFYKIHCADCVPFSHKSARALLLHFNRIRAARDSQCLRCPEHSAQNLDSVSKLPDGESRQTSFRAKQQTSCRTDNCTFVEAHRRQHTQLIALIFHSPHS